MKNKNLNKVLIFILIVFIILLLLRFCSNNNKTYSLTINLNYETENKELIIELKTKEEYKLELPNRDGYKFINWSIDGKNSKIKNNKFIMGIEDTTITANWEKQIYKIEYNLNGGIQENNAITNYDKETDTFFLPTPNKNGYTFLGWYDNKEYTGSVQNKIEQGTTGDKSYYAKWTPIIYNIKYELNGGTLKGDIKKQYNITSDNIILIEPTKKDYIFLGWTGSNGNVPEKNVFILNGETGDKKYTANWKAIEYKITYNVNGGTIAKDATKVFTANTKTFKLPTPTKKGYTFKGWYTNSNLTGSAVTKIYKGTRTNKTYYAKWELTTYKIKYDLNGGNVGSDLTTKYTIKTETFTLQNPTKSHYVFIGWTGSNGNTVTKNVSITKGTTGNKEYVANYKPLEYKINYILNGGNLNNPINKYNIETETFDLPIPTKAGYKFIGWCNDKELTSETITQLIKGTIGEQTYYAKWEPVNYEITYELNGGTQGENPIINYNIEMDDFNLPIPTKEGYEFKGWYKDELLTGTAIVKVEKGTSGNKTYYAKWEENKSYENSTIYDIVQKDAILDNVASTFVTNVNGIDFKKASSITNGYGIYLMSSTKNDQYPIYYYRGAVTNNNVLFANYCWKILRTTDTGGIKLLYSGVPDANNQCNNSGGDTMLYAGKAYTSTSIGIAGAGYSYTDKTSLKLTAKNDKTVTEGTIFAYDITYDQETGLYILSDDQYLSTTNFTSEKDEKVSTHHYTCFKTTNDGCSSVYYVYMGRDAQIFYATLKNGQKIDDLLKIEFDGNSTNVNKSTIHTTIETWYESEMTNFTTYLEDTVFCNDRSLYNPWNLTSSIANDNDTKMHFATKARIAYLGTPTTQCKYKADSFTVDEKNGNGNLKYPVGLITFDEANLAGSAWNESSSNSFLYNEKVWWTMSPGFVSATGVYNGVIHSSLDHVAVNYTGSNGSAGGIRPTISLNKNVKIQSGDGSSQNPFIIAEQSGDITIKSLSYNNTNISLGFKSIY